MRSFFGRDHVADDVVDLLPSAPGSSEYVPAGQSQQASATRIDRKNLPAGHNEQVAADADVAPVGPYFPAEQGVPEQVDEDVAPTPSEYVPAGQGWQY